MLFGYVVVTVSLWVGAIALMCKLEGEKTNESEPEEKDGWSSEAGKEILQHMRMGNPIFAAELERGIQRRAEQVDEN